MDLPDLALPGTIRGLDVRSFRAALERVFAFCRVQPLPARLPAPPADWAVPTRAWPSRTVCRGGHWPRWRGGAPEARCPKCNMRLWVSPIPRKLRFYDLRHTHATLLRKAGVDLGAVQRNLGHSSPEITAAVYDHSDLEDFRADVDRALTFGEPARVNAPAMQGADSAKSEGPEAIAFARNLGAFELSGRLDLNQRPLAPQASALPGCATPRVRQGRDR